MCGQIVKNIFTPSYNQRRQIFNFIYAKYITG